MKTHRKITAAEQKQLDAIKVEHSVAFQMLNECRKALTVAEEKKNAFWIGIMKKFNIDRGMGLSINPKNQKFVSFSTRAEMMQWQIKMKQEHDNEHRTR